MLDSKDCSQTCTWQRLRLTVKGGPHAAGQFFIRYVESKLIWDFAAMYSKDKLCNKD